jgi:hypothetical protein
VAEKKDDLPATAANSAVPSTLPPEMPTGAGPTVPETRPPSMPTAANAAIPTTQPPELPSFGTMQMPRGKMPSREEMLIPPSTPIMPTFTGGPTKVTNLPPSMPHERYAIGDEIARGGMGRVVEANDVVLGRTVALKEALALDADSLKRFERETKITARLEHPSIVPVHDAGTMLGGAPYYVMRKISGRPLERLVALAETLDERLALVPHIVNAANAIAHAHERGVVHRDIKPSNILVGDLGETIVIDWGLAKLINEADDPLVSPVTIEPLDAIKTRAGIVYGTPGFMAPEQLRGKTVTERCDVYALGATLYHLLGRKPPHHAKTADEMMKAAAHAPPPPITDIVEGVPPELSTIIDKCLAFDAADRYQTARELAEDLQRFLTGQLVASHHYSRTERARRFVKRNKVPVAAVGVLILGLALAFVRVRGERDRADESARIAVAQKQKAEAERKRAEHELQRVTLQQAKNEVETNPTRAIARIRNLAGLHPRDVRSIAIAARAAGVAWALPASKSSRSLEMSKDGERVLTAGEDGVIRVHDLTKRTTTKVVEMGTAMAAAFADNERHVVVWNDKKLVVMAASGGDRRDVTPAAPIIDLEVAGMTAYWNDTTGRVWMLDLARTEPVEMQLPEAIKGLALSPDGRFLAMRGAAHLLVHDRTKAAEPPFSVTIGVTHDIDWSADGKFFAALVDDLAIAVRVEGFAIVNRRIVGERQECAYSNDRVFAIGRTGVTMIPADTTASRKPLVGEPINIAEARGNTVVAASQGGIAALHDSGDIALVLPAGRVEILDASAHSPYVVAAVEDHLLVWNLDEMQAKRIDVDAPVETMAFIGNDKLLASHSSGTPTWLDLSAAKAAQLPNRVSIFDVAGAPSGARACIVDVARTAMLVAPDAPAIPLEGTVSHVGFPTERDLILADEEFASVRHYDVEKKTYANLVERKGAKLLDIAWSRSQKPAWIAAAFSDGTIWRKNLETNEAVTASQPVKITSRMLVLGDGTVLFAEGRTLRAWRPGGADATIEAHADLPGPAAAIGIAGNGPAIAITGQGATYLVDLDARDHVTEVDPINTGKIAMAVDTGMYVVSTADGFDVVDPIARHRWTLGRTKNLPYRDPKISPDGRRVIAHTTKRADGGDGPAVIVWTLPDPASTLDLVKWLDTMTNATLDDTGRLGWK